MVFFMNNHTMYMNKYGDNRIGARIIGIEIRNLAINILNSDPNARITFDFSGIEYISSGFAKELFGELYVYLGKEFINKVAIKTPQENQIIKEIIIRAIKLCK